MAGDAVRLRQFIDREPNLPQGIIHHQGKDVGGYFPGQIARVHLKYPTESKPGHFTKLQPVPVKDEVAPLHEFDHLVLKRYIQYQKTKKKCIDWYTQTTYREAFALPFYIYKSDNEEDYRQMTDAEILAVWKSTPAMKRTAVKPSYMGV